MDTDKDHGLIPCTATELDDTPCTAYASYDTPWGALCGTHAYRAHLRDEDMEHLPHPTP